ncbi:competence/damage-inducible protein A [Marichromatium bheemlicum]|uniref:Competence/damage-inducible protein A n=1 Tax=Marichromatium bheemlicum TaxID=365339 RepID=A0ABX1I4R1_9GAMM|nr:molybdopterin-binding protein [Marichromatium bheemlicum]NKN32544.1 competence/damage-inducible protein A [Marichromatium bheemlicum]
MATETPQRFGLIVIGDEVLNGTRRDQHLERFKEMIGSRGHELAWQWMLPDDPEVITAHLRFSMARAEPVFVCGGIGATPDDHTRGCAAAAAGVALTRHPEAVALLEEKFGETAYPHRILMAELPEGSALIANPVNRIPGFRVADHWFLPGFPKMAWPMAAQVLETHYGTGSPQREVALKVCGIPESQLIPVMESFGARFPALKMFSLPHMGEDPHILLGFRGRAGLDEALAALREALGEAAVEEVAPR